eukprot:7647367-Pyramimonas_sp.AAC.1
MRSGLGPKLGRKVLDQVVEQFSKICIPLLESSLSRARRSPNLAPVRRWATPRVGGERDPPSL